MMPTWVPAGCAAANAVSHLWNYAMAAGNWMANHNYNIQMRICDSG